MIVTGESNGLIETVEVKDHPWFLGVQFHPEFTSRLQTPNPSILAFVNAMPTKRLKELLTQYKTKSVSHS